MLVCDVSYPRFIQSDHQSDDTTHPRVSDCFLRYVTAAYKILDTWPLIGVEQRRRKVWALTNPAKPGSGNCAVKRLRSEKL